MSWCVHHTSQHGNLQLNQRMKRIFNLLAALLPLLLVACGGNEKSTLWGDIAPFFQVPAEWQGDFGDYRSPLLFENGDTVRTAEQWALRREEIKTLWHSKMGQWPEIIYNQPLTKLDTVQLEEGIVRHRVRFNWTPNEQTEGYLLVPTATKGPKPAAIVVFYEPETALGMEEGLKYGPHRDFAIQLARRGFVALSLGTTETSISRTYSIRYPSKGNETVEPLSMLGYAAANAYEALALEEDVNGDKIGIVGHSYGGKWAMFASCFYEKFACAAWGDPGIVFSEEKGGYVNYWEPWYLGSLGTYDYMKTTGHDLHEVHALMAPRPFLVSGGYSDEPKQWRALNHSVEVNKVLGYEGRVGMTNRELHAPNPEANEVIYKFFEYYLK